MDPITLGVIANALVGAGVVSLPILAARRQRARRRRSWRAAAEQAGLSELQAGSSSLGGRAGQLPVRIELYHLGRDRGTRIVVGGLQHAPLKLALRKESAGTALKKRWRGGDDVQCGDARFDDDVYLEGAPELALAVLDAQTRAQILALLKGGSRADVEDGELWVDIPEGRRALDAETLRGVIELGERLRRPEDIPARLARNARDDPRRGVRVRNVRALLEAFPDHDQTRQALHAALGDPDDEVRLQAALSIGEGGSQTLLELASSERTDDALAERAIQAVGHRLQVDDVEAILARARRTQRPATARACVDWLGLRGGPEVIPTIVGVLASADRELAVGAARALAAAGTTTAEGPLREALDLGHDPEVLVAVARALGRVGSTAAVMPLRAAAERVGDGDVARAVRQAIAEIQARLQGAAPGQLSLATGEEGRVSLVGEDDARGQLSLPEPLAPEPGAGGE